VRHASEPGKNRPAIVISVDESAAICRGVRAVPRSRLLRPVGRLRPDTLCEVERALATILGLDRPAASSRG
jgi:mRNA-degrading endonuclease toxin of MazEF toxin-antitoxin module